MYVELLRKADTSRIMPAGLYMERREELGHPLGVVPPAAGAPPPVSDASSPPTCDVDFVLEVGCEELPPQDVRTAMEQLRCTAR